MPDEHDWTRLIARIAERGRGPLLRESDVRAAEERLGFALPRELRRLYLDLGNGGFAGYFIPLINGREDETFVGKGLDPAEAFRLAMETQDSVVAWHKGRRQDEPDDVWPNGLLLTCEYGCAIYFAIDLIDPALRVIEYEYLEPSTEAEDTGFTLAYTDERVPISQQARFTLAADSLFVWLERWLDRGADGVRAPKRR